MGELITNTGIEQVANLFCGHNNDVFAWIAIGTGSSEPTQDDTHLEAEVARKQATAVVETSTDESGNFISKVIFTAVFEPGEVSGIIREIGLFNAEVGGVMYYRKVRDEGLGVGDDVGLEVVVEVSFTRGV